MPFIWDDEQQGGVAAPPVSLPQPPQQPTTNGFVWDDQQPQLQVPEPLVVDPTFGGRYVASQPSPDQRALMVQAGRVDPLGLAMNPVGLSALSLPTLPADNELATKVWKSSGKTWREMTDAERRQAVEMDTIDQAQTPEAKQRLIRDSVARDQELQPGYKIDQSKLPPKPAGTPVPIPQQVLDATLEQIQGLPDGPEKDRLIQAHATGQQLSAQARADIAAAEARGTSTVQNEAAQSPRMQALSNLGGQNIGGDVARGVLLGLTGVGNTVTNVLLRTADKARRRLAAGEDGTQPVGQGIFGDADSYVNRRNDALEFGRQAMSANQGERSIFPASMVQNASETLTTIGAMDALGIPIIPGFAAQIADTTYSDDRKKGLSEDKAAFHAAGTAALQSALMLMAGRAGKELGLIPREELMSPAMAKAAQDVFTKEGLGTATKNILFQGGEGAAIHIAQSAFDAATGARPDALDPENLWPEAGKAGFDWAALGVLGTAGHAGPEAVRSAWARALNKLPGAMSRAHAAEQRLIDQLASNRAISRSDLEAVGVSTRGYKPREFNALAEQYIQDQLMPREVQKQRQDYMEQQSKFIPAAMNRFTTLNPQMPGGPESFIAGPQGGAESFTVDRNTVLPEVPDAQGIGKQVEAGSEAQGAQGQASGGVRVRDDATSDGLEAGPQEVAQPKQPWEMTYDEVLKAVNPSNREELQAARPILAALYPEEIDNGPDQWGIRRAIEKGDELPRTPTVELSRRHRDAIRAALDAGLPVPENVLAEYPDLASSRAQPEIRNDVLDEIEQQARGLERFSALPIAQYGLTPAEQQELVRRGMSFTVDRMGAPHVRLSDSQRAKELRDKVTSKSPQEPSNGSQEQAGQVGEEVQQVNAEGQGRQSDAQAQELLGGAVPKNPLVTEQQPVDQSPAVSARQPRAINIERDSIPEDFDVTYDAIRAKTRERVPIKQNAREAYDELEASASKFKSLLECLRS